MLLLMVVVAVMMLMLISSLLYFGFLIRSLNLEYVCRNQLNWIVTVVNNIYKCMWFKRSLKSNVSLFVCCAISLFAFFPVWIYERAHAHTYTSVNAQKKAKQIIQNQWYMVVSLVGCFFFSRFHQNQKKEINSKSFI